MAAAPVTYADIKKQLASGRPAPVYLIHGEEGYYADRLAREFETMVPEQDRQFNLTILYGAETTADAVMNACRAYPMMGGRQVVLLKEAQAMRADQLNKLHCYVERPSDTCTLAIICRGAAAKGKDLIAAVKKHGGLAFEGKKLTEYKVGPEIIAMARERGLSMDTASAELLRDHVGADLAKIDNQLQKLEAVLGAGARVTPEAIERHVGISKEYNNFELIDALNARNALRAFRIVDYFAANPKSNPTVMTTSALFGHFASLLVYHYTADRTPGGYMAALGLRADWQLRRFTAGARQYNVRQVIEIISAIRRFDAMSKGVGSRQGEYPLLRDLVFHILTAAGNIGA